MERRWLALQNRRDHAGRACTLEGPFAGQHLVQHAPEAEKIAARVGFLALQLLRRHILQRAENLSLGCQRLRHSAVGFSERRGFEFRQPEVQQLDALLRHEDVGGLQIPVRDAFVVRGI